MSQWELGYRKEQKHQDRKTTREQDVEKAQEEKSQMKTCPKKDHSFISSRLHPCNINRGNGLSLSKSQKHLIYTMKECKKALSKDKP
jgi:hypothetical protein